MKRMLMLAVMMLTLVGVLAACGEADIEKKETGGNKSEEKANKKENKEKKEEKDEKLSVGDTVVFDGTEVTLNELRIEKGGDFDTPTEDKFVVANITLENTTDKEINVSSILGFELKDNEGYSYNTTILMEGTKGSMDGAVEPGGTLRGEIPFDVPNSDVYELHYSDLFKSGKVIWRVPSGDLK